MSTLRIVPVALVLCLSVGCVSSQDIDSLANQVNDVQQQLLVVQKQAPSKAEVESLETSIGAQMTNLLQSEANMQVRLNALGDQIDQLQAKLEDTNYRLAQLSQQIAATNQELKTFRTQQELYSQPPPPTDGGLSPQGSASVTPTDPQALYQSSYSDYLRGNYDLATLGFEEYLANFPQTDLADNATYWIGECYYRQSNFREAVNQFDEVIRRYPRSDKAPSALLKKGYAYLELGDRSQAVVQLQFVVREYPNTDEANIARERLKAIGVDLGR